MTHRTDPPDITLGDQLRGTIGAAMDSTDDALQAIRDARHINLHQIIAAEGQLTVARSCLEAALKEIGPAPR